MIVALQALRTVLEGATGAPVHIGDATGSLPPFVVLWSPQWGRDRDGSLGSCGSWQAQLGVTFTGDSLERALELADVGVAALTPSRDAAQSHLMPGRLLQIKFFEQRSQDVVRSVTLPESDSHPASVVALFDLHSQPMEAP